MNSIAKMRLKNTPDTKMPPKTSKKVSVKIFAKTSEKGKTLLTHTLIKLLKVLETRKRLPLNHTRKEV